MVISAAKGTFLNDFKQEGERGSHLLDTMYQVASKIVFLMRRKGKGSIRKFTIIRDIIYECSLNLNHFEM